MLTAENCKSLYKFLDRVTVTGIQENLEFYFIVVAVREEKRRAENPEKVDLKLVEENDDGS